MRSPRILLALAAALVLAAPAGAVNSPARVKAFARLPDWTGIWLSDSEQSDLGGRTNLRQFRFMEPPPYNPAWEAKHQERLARMRTKATAEAPTIRQCIIDFPATMESPQPFELIVTPEETVFTAGDGTFRHIFTDGRGHPSKDDLWPTITGHSTGHWEGETLVVDSVGFTADTALGPGWGVRHSDQMHIVERMHLSAPDTLEIVTTIDDPKALTKPFTATKILKRHRDWDIAEYVCEQNNRNLATDKGKAGIILNH